MWQATEVQQCLHCNIYVSGPILVKIAIGFYLNIYHLAIYLRLQCRKFFLRNLKSFPSSWLAARYFFILRIVAIYIHFEIVLFIFLAEKGTHRLTKVTVREPWLKFIVQFISGCLFSYWLNTYEILSSVTQLASQLDFFFLFFSTLHLL